MVGMMKVSTTQDEEVEEVDKREMALQSSQGERRGAHEILRMVVSSPIKKVNCNLLAPWTAAQWRVVKPANGSGLLTSAPLSISTERMFAWPKLAA